MPFVERPGGAGLHYEVFGAVGPPLFCGPPLRPSEPPDGSVMTEAMVKEFIEGLSGDYRVLIVDYPYGLGKSSPAIAEGFTVERVTSDLLAVADAAGFDRFAWYGYSFGASCGLQLALRTNRLTALVAAGFPPIGAEYDVLLDICRAGLETPFPTLPRTYMQQFVTYYEGLQDFDDRTEISRIDVPRMTFVGNHDGSKGGTHHYARTIDNCELLERLGWQVQVLGDQDHKTGLAPQHAIPLLRKFLDPLLLQKAR